MDWVTIASIVTATIAAFGAFAYVGNIVLDRWARKSFISNEMEALESRMKVLEENVDLDLRVTIKQLQNKQSDLRAAMNQQHLDFMDRMDRMENKILDVLSRNQH